jgi:hypothetical protein
MKIKRGELKPRLPMLFRDSICYNKVHPTVIKPGEIILVSAWHSFARFQWSGFGMPRSCPQIPLKAKYYERRDHRCADTTVKPGPQQFRLQEY